jgi:hypothetical protein
MNGFEELRRLTERAVASTSPIYVSADDGSMHAVGTGIFFKHHDRPFVLSAGHVLRRLRAERLSIGEQHLVILNGRFFTTPNEDVDLGFVPLTDDELAATGGAVCLTSDDLEISERPELSDDGHQFCVVGFRAEDNVPEGTPTTVHAVPSSYLACAATDETYRRLGLSAATNLVLAFNRNKLFAEPRRLEQEAEPEGLSGSGVWQSASGKLVAVLIEHSNAQKAIVSTRIAPLLTALSDYTAGMLG